MMQQRLSHNLCSLRVQRRLGRRQHGTWSSIRAQRSEVRPHTAASPCAPIPVANEKSLFCTNTPGVYYNSKGTKWASY